MGGCFKSNSFQLEKVCGYKGDEITLTTLLKQTAQKSTVLSTKLILTCIVEDLNKPPYPAMEVSDSCDLSSRFIWATIV